MVKQERFIGTSANVIAMVQGWRRPNEAIVIGCHHDAWGYGAADPCAGTICLLEAARCVAELTKQGIWPERSIIFAAWGAEEFGIIGSTEWVEGHDQEMTNRVVAYVNLDMAAMGPNLSIALTPELAGAARDAAGMVPAARNHGTTALAAMMADHKESPLFGTLGGGSDHVGFVCRLVVPSIAISAGGAEGTSYHSNYDTTAWYRATVGEDYEPAILVTRTTLAFTALMADQRVLPYQYGEIGRQALAALDDLQKLAANDAEKAAVESLRTPLVALRAQGELVDAALAQGRELDPQSDIRVASGMKKFVKAFFDAAGLPDRPWYRNLWVATDDSNSYAPCVLPLVREALQQHDAKRLEEGVARTAEAIQRATLAADLMLLGLRSPGAVPEQGRQ
jgi:N-acetylated-alpha-linked acidic dipeptidase